MKKSSIAILVASLCGAAAANAGVTGNIAASSDYVWRGITQTDHASAVSGGIDYSHDSGAYVGGWASNVSSNTELDLYAGYGAEFQGVGVDVGYIEYIYPAPPSGSDFGEVYLGLSYGDFSGKYSYDTDNKNGYLEVAYGTTLKGFDVGAHLGSYSLDTGNDYIDGNVSIGKTISGTEWSWAATVNYANVKNTKDPRPFPIVSISRSFDM